MDRRELLRLSFTCLATSFASAAMASANTPLADARSPMTVDEAVGMLDADALVALVIDATDFWYEKIQINKTRVCVNAAVQAGYALSMIEGRRIGVGELCAFHDFGRMHEMAQDERIPWRERDACRNWLVHLPGYVEGVGPDRQSRKTRDQHAWVSMYAARKMDLLRHYGDGRTARQILAGKVDWKALDARWRRA